jgi:hypothetical protein
LAKASNVGVATIRRAEVVDGEIPVTLANEAALRQALEAAGVEFTNGEQPGVRLTGAAAAQSAKTLSASISTALRRKTGKSTEKKR